MVRYAKFTTGIIRQKSTFPSPHHCRRGTGPSHVDAGTWCVDTSGVITAVCGGAFEARPPNRAGHSSATAAGPTKHRGRVEDPSRP